VKQASIVISPIGAIRDRFDLSPMDGCIICLLSRKEGTVKTWRYRRRSALREVAAWLAYLCDSSVFVDFYEVWAEKVHPVAAKLSGRPAKIINVYQPAGKMEEFFREVSTFKNLPTREDVINKTYTEEQVQALDRLFSDHGMDLLGPPLLEVDEDGRITQIA